MNNRINVVIAAVPYVDTYRPLAAPAALKAALNDANINCVALDLNSVVVAKVDKHLNKELFLDFFYKKKIHQEVVEELSRLIEYCASKILKENPTIIGLSLFCSTCQTFTSWLCAAIKQQAPDIKIVIGGPGLQPLKNLTFDYSDYLKRRNLIDDYIIGDAEVSLVEYVRGNTTYPGINSLNWQLVESFNDLPMPDYSDYDFFWYNEPSIPIIDSRGCVQDCEFCDVVAFWKKFQYKTADKIFTQMLQQIEKHRIFKFDFRSSISNGNLQEFRKLVKLISDYNKNKFCSEQISIECSFIIRQGNAHSEELWKHLKDSNAWLFLGVESLAEDVRYRIGKKFTNDAIDHHIQMAHKYQIPINLLFIASYVGETTQDQELTKKWFKEHKEYANNPIKRIQMVKGVAVLPGTKLEKQLLEHLTVDELDQVSTLSDEQKKYVNELEQIIVDCGFSL